MNPKDKLIKAGVIRKGHFLMEDGRHADTWLDVDRLVSDPELFEETIIRLEMIKTPISMSSEWFDIIIGTPGIGTILAAPIALRTGKQFVYLEKMTSVHDNSYYYLSNGKPVVETSIQLPKSFCEQIKGKKVMLITDIITTGKSIKETTACIEKTGSTVVEIRCIWNRGQIEMTRTEFVGGPKTVPILSIISDPVESWTEDECPLCQPICPGCNGIGFPFDDAEDKCCMCNGTGKLSVIPLTNPKAGEVI